MKTAAQRAAKRFKRENRADKGAPKPIPVCRTCGYKLTRFGCPQCNPSIWSIGEEMVMKGEISPEQALVTWAMLNRRRGL